MLISVNSDTTSNTTPEKTNLSSEDLGGGQGQESGTNSIGLENANWGSERKKPQTNDDLWDELWARGYYVVPIGTNGVVEFLVVSTKQPPYIQPTEPNKSS